MGGAFPPLFFMLTNIELDDLIFDEGRGGYWLKPQAQRSTKGRCQSPAEVAFWQVASVQIPGLVRQFHVKGTRYHLDFALPEEKIGIEVDGHQWHSSRKQRQHDSQRDRILTGLGWRILRFTASEILRNADGCAAEVAAIMKNCQES